MSLNKLLSFARLRRGVVAISLLAGAALLALQVTSVGADYSVILEGSGTRLQDGSCQVEAKVTVKDGRSKSPPLKITFDENCEPQLRAMTEAEYRALPQAPNDLPDEGAPAATATAPVAQTPASISVADGPLSVGDRIADLLEKADLGHHKHASSSPAVCASLTTLRDPVDVPETETRNKQTWSFNGTQVTSASTSVNGFGLGLPTRTNYANWSSYGGQTVPASAIQAFGYSKFHWNFGWYSHTLYADAVSYGSNLCDGASHAVVGTVPGSAYITVDHHIE